MMLASFIAMYQVFAMYMGETSEKIFYVGESLDITPNGSPFRPALDLIL